MPFGFLDFPFGPLLWQIALGVIAALLVWLVVRRRLGGLKFAVLIVIGIIAAFVTDAVLLMAIAPQLTGWTDDGVMTLLSAAAFAVALIVCLGAARAMRR